MTLHSIHLSTNHSFPAFTSVRNLGVTFDFHLSFSNHISNLSRSCFIVIVIVNSRFLERPQKRSRWKQLIDGRLTKIKSTGSGQDPESGRQADMHADMQSDCHGGWRLELRRGGKQGRIKPSGAPCQIYRGALCPLPISFHYSIS